MTKLILSILLLLAFVTQTQAMNSHYVSINHLHKIFNKVKREYNVSERALARAFEFYEKNRYAKKLSSTYIAIADYTKTAREKRLYIINLHSGEVNRHLVAHGKNSGSVGGRVWRSSNTLNSLMTPFGFFKVGSQERITSRKKYKYLSIDGLEWKNRNARKREILLHTASYVTKGGRSYGCFAIDPKVKRAVFNKLKTALLYSYTGR